MSNDLLPINFVDQIIRLLLLSFGIFSSGVFITYYSLVLKGYTVIEAAERYANIARRVSGRLN